MAFGNWPARGILQVVGVLALGAVMFFQRNGPRGNRNRPSFFEEFQSGNPSDLAALFLLFWLIVLGYAVAVTISDYRANGRLW